MGPNVAYLAREPVPSGGSNKSSRAYSSSATKRCFLSAVASSVEASSALLASTDADAPLAEVLAHHDDALCQCWETWAHAIAKAAEEGSDLPAPPKALAGYKAPSSVTRITEAATFAAAALARAYIESSAVRVDAAAADAELVQSQAAVRLLRSKLETLGSKDEGAEQGLCEEVRRLGAKCERLQTALEMEKSLRRQVEQNLPTQCRRCSEARGELERARWALEDSDALRRKEIEDAWCMAEAAESKHQQTLSLLRDLVGAGASAASLPPASPRLGGSGTSSPSQLPSQLASVSSSAHRRALEASRPSPSHASSRRGSGSIFAGGEVPAAAWRRGTGATTDAVAVESSVGAAEPEAEDQEVAAAGDLEEWPMRDGSFGAAARSPSVEDLWDAGEKPDNYVQKLATCGGRDFDGNKANVSSYKEAAQDTSALKRIVSSGRRNSEVQRAPSTPPRHSGGNAGAESWTAAVRAWRREK